MTANVCAGEDPNELLAVTEMVPDDPGVATILLVVLLPLHPVGSVQVYEVAPETGLTEKVEDVPWQRVVIPEIGPG